MQAVDRRECVVHLGKARSTFRLLPGCRRIPFDDLDALEAALRPRDVAAFVVEPIQGHGVFVPGDDYLREAAALCRRHGTLFVADEVQTGLGRIGALFGVNHWNVVPDIMCLAKALSGGVIPCGSFTTTDAIFASFHANPMFHSSTFGNNPLAATAAAKAIEITVREKLPERSARLGARLLERLRGLQAKHPTLVRQVRGKGLLIGVELDPKHVSARGFVETLLRHGILSKDTHGTVARFAPALVVEREDLDWAVERFIAALREYGPVYERAA